MHNSELADRDLRVLWHPCTQMKDHEWLPMVAIRRAKGVWIEDYSGKRYLDAISSWWVNILGHCHPRLVRALQRQVGNLDHVLLAGFTHEPAVLLAERLLQLAPQGLSRCFYTDNGSTAVEAAMKMSFHYWQRRGRPQKKQFVCLEGAYHGETLGALSVGQVPLYRKVYQPLLLDVLTAPSPAAPGLPRDQWLEHARAAFASMQSLLEQNKDSISAVIIEPLVQCAAGMHMYHSDYLVWLKQLCQQLDIHLIADEIAVGFGRTGTMFACEQSGIEPDFMCVGKGLTGGVLPLAAVLTNEEIYDAFYCDYLEQGAFLHSHSYTGNPLACRAALETITLLQQQQMLLRNSKIAVNIWQQAQQLWAQHPHVSDIRQYGMITAIELALDGPGKVPYPWQERRGLQVFRNALDNGVLLRPLGDVVYFMPPYVITDQQVDFMMAGAAAAIATATGVT
ncbi:MAG: adenosylmethionine--8-amino-7-oxononanoate transaminase [Candidatus Porifericomitaceae bacterium WSBS_2022_MAG_OTU9]